MAVLILQVIELLIKDAEENDLRSSSQGLEEGEKGHQYEFLQMESGLRISHLTLPNSCLAL